MKSVHTTRPTSEIIKERAASEKLNLPVFPGAAFELQQLLSDDSISIDQITKVISKDQALATQVLKLANSAYFSGSNSVRTIREAIMRLGLNHVFNLVICTSQQNYYKSKNKIIEKYLQVSWKHALCTAIGSKWLVQELGYRKMGDEAFLAGLLHDIGKLLILKSIEKVKIEDDAMELADALIADALESMHVEQGYSLMDEWSIPPIYCRVALDHHKENFDTDDVLYNVLLMAVRIANQTCRKAGISTHPDKSIKLAELPEVHALAIKESVLDELETVIAEAIKTEYKY